MVRLLPLLAAFVLPQAPQTSEDPMKGLSFLLGKWESQEKTKGQDGKEISFSLKGSNALTLDGKCLQIDENFEIAGRRYANHILMTHDRAAGKYRIWWFSASQPARPLVLSGVRSEDKFVLTSDDDRMRITYNLKKDGEYSAVVDVKRGENWEPTTTAEYRRTGTL
ncbi:MAG: hypothetical protein ACO1SV_23385 [Fimbriimonas sp.]